MRRWLLRLTVLNTLGLVGLLVLTIGPKSSRWWEEHRRWEDLRGLFKNLTLACQETSRLSFEHRQQLRLYQAYLEQMHTTIGASTKQLSDITTHLQAIHHDDP